MSEINFRRGLERQSGDQVLVFTTSTMSQQMSLPKNWILYLSTAVIFCAMSFLLGACSTVRKATYPPNFVYLDNAEVHSAMQDMAISIDTLDKLLNSDTLDSENKNERVIETLDQLKSATDGMGANASISNHRIISDNMGSFRARVAEARVAASSDTPDYNLSGRLVAECLSCHVKNANYNSFF